MEQIKELSIDLETFSKADIKKCGVYRYAEDDSFEILLFAVSINNGSVVVYDLALGEKLPNVIIDALVDDNVTKWAFNANFERVCLSYWLKKYYPHKFKSYSTSEDTVGNYLNPDSWRCTMIWSAYMGLPLSLEGVGAVLKLEQQKMNEGKDLIRYFCIPCKPTQKNCGRTRNLPIHDLDKWKIFKEYNKRDVEVELAIKNKLAKFPVPEQVWEEYHLDQVINDRGIGVDLALVQHAIEFDERSKNKISSDMKELTSIENPNSVAQVKDWLQEQGLEVDTLGRKVVEELIKTSPEKIANVLALRKQLAKSSVKKYQAMQNAVCKDGRCRGMFQFYGANRTGRWSGRLIQLQNLPQNHITDLAQARTLVKSNNYAMLELLYDDIPDTLSQLVRTAFISKPGYLYHVVDFSAIEARVLSYIAGETWRSDVFKSGEDIYCMSASQMFGVPVEKHGINGHLRQKGKIAELACGYGGSVGALKAMGALDMGLKEEELQSLVDMWRSSNPNIVEFWWNVDNAVKHTVKTRTSSEVNGIKFEWKSGILFIHLPSGRSLSYVKPKIAENQFGGESVTYEGIGTANKWERIESYGPKFVENIVQAISRDILTYAMKTLKNMYIVGHVHDELIIECDPEIKLQIICGDIARSPSWMKDILLRGDGYITPWYRKD